MQDLYLFGSKALLHWYPDAPFEPKDTDWISTFKPCNAKDNHEFFWCNAMKYIQEHNRGWIIQPELLYTIKLSHMPWDLKNNKWWRHMKQLVFMQEKGLQYIPEFHVELQKDWKVLHGAKDQINLNKSVKDFFNDKVNRLYSHDELHEYFKLGSRPAYTLMQPNSDSAYCSEEYFKRMKEHEKLNSVLEEIFVIAFERNLSFAEGYKHLCTRISKGFWNTYALTQAKKILVDSNEVVEYYKRKRSKLITTKEEI